MLDKKSENVLKISISKYDGDMDKDINIYGRDVELTFSELNSLCFNLYNSGYISNFFYSYGENEAVKITLSHNGLNYFKLKKAEHVQYLKQLAVSKLSDIIVSVIVALITTLITLQLCG